MPSPYWKPPVAIPLKLHVCTVGIIIAIFTSLGVSGVYLIGHQAETNTKLRTVIQQATDQTRTHLMIYEDRIASSQAKIQALETDDQLLRNDRLLSEIYEIKTSFATVAAHYEELVKLRESGAKTSKVDAGLADSIGTLARWEYATATAKIATVEAQIATLKKEIAAAAAAELQTVAAQVAIDPTVPSDGFKTTGVSVNGTTFVVDIIGASLTTTKVVAMTASSGDCGDNCPVDSLASYVSKAGGYAGVNGPYFCPESYPSCAGKKNSFDTLLMNRDKTYFNSANNIYSTVPAAIFGSGYARFVGASSEWGRDTGPDSVIAGQPLLLLNSEVRFGGDSEVKRNSRGARVFLAAKGSSAYIGVVRNANVAEVALVLKALNMDHAINLDSGGSTAMYVNSRYVWGPGRNTPFGIVFVRR